MWAVVVVPVQFLQFSAIAVMLRIRPFPRQVGVQLRGEYVDSAILDSLAKWKYFDNKVIL